MHDSTLTWINRYLAYNRWAEDSLPARQRSCPSYRRHPNDAV